jgi:uncharacterized protein YjeT (DUF2065 family)
MELSLLLAKVYAVLFLLLGLGMFLNPKYYRKVIDEMLGNKGMILFSGMMAATAGVLMVTYHNIWDSSWVVLITIFGWVALLKGVGLLVFPKHIEFWRKLFKKPGFMQFEAVAVTALGLLFVYFGWFA